jgi:hypothetical protein
VGEAELCRLDPSVPVQSALRWQERMIGGRTGWHARENVADESASHGTGGRMHLEEATVSVTRLAMEIDQWAATAACICAISASAVSTCARLKATWSGAATAVVNRPRPHCIAACAPPAFARTAAGYAPTHAAINSSLTEHLMQFPLLEDTIAV